MCKVLVLDTETTINGGGIHDKDLTHIDGGGAFNPDNKLVCCAYIWKGQAFCVPLISQEIIDEADIIIGFNFKFDYHWLRRYGIELGDKKIWDCQNAEFTISRQQTPYPSLDGCCEKYGLGKKLDVIKEQYWKKGIDTDCIPWKILSEYAIHDVVLTEKLYQVQKNSEKARLISLSCQDLHVLADMEWNGLRYNREESLKQAKENRAKILEIEKSLYQWHNLPCFNWGSDDHLSCLLFGGIIRETARVPSGVFKTGKKVGEIKFRLEEREHVLPGLFKPSVKNKRAKEGYYFVNEDVLTKLGKTHPVVTGILEMRKLEKLCGTYLEGLPARQDEMNCNREYIYGQYNQCVARTGRLSSSKPNCQNLLDECLRLIISRF